CYEDAGRDDHFRVELPELHGFIYLRDRDLRRARHRRPVVACAFPVHEVAPAVAALGLYQRKVPVQRVLEHLSLAVDDPRLLALREVGAKTCRSKEPSDARARGAHAFGQRPLRDELQLDLAAAVRLLEMVRVDLARIGADELTDAPRFEQRGNPDLAVARVVVDDDQVLRALRDQSVDQLLGYARAAEAADENGRAVAHVGERRFDRGGDLVYHVRGTGYRG